MSLIEISSNERYKGNKGKVGGPLEGDYLQLGLYKRIVTEEYIFLLLRFRKYLISLEPTGVDTIIEQGEHLIYPSHQGSPQGVSHVQNEYDN